MKKVIFVFVVIIGSYLITVCTGCNTNNPEPPYPVYSYLDPIVDPPDVFQVVYNISQAGDRLAYITFKEDAVWLVEKLGDARIYYWANNGTINNVIEGADTLALQGGFNYVFGANNNNYNDFNNFFTQFNKLEIDYDTFEPKF